MPIPKREFVAFDTNSLDTDRLQELVRRACVALANVRGPYPREDWEEYEERCVHAALGLQVMVVVESGEHEAAGERHKVYRVLVGTEKGLARARKALRPLSE